ncbi:MAG: DUF504 domain-containing protein [Steroidobacteraceae bacterium]
MIPIHELLARIRWDPAFGRGEFVIGYLDHDTSELRHAALRDARPDPENPSMLDIVDEHGLVVSLPLHRIRQVLRNGEVIWQRATPARPHEW